MTLLERARQQGTPLVDGENVLFVWHGDNPPQLIGDFNGWGWNGNDPTPLQEVEPGIWAHMITLPRDAYIEYSYTRDGKRLIDPLNPRNVGKGEDGDNNFFVMPDCSMTAPISRRRNIAHGTLTRHEIEDIYQLIGGKRRVHLYQPATSEPSPLLVVLDGQDYIHQGKIIHIVDNLIAQGRIPPIAMALLHHGKAARVVEYSCSETTVGVLLRHVLPLADKHLNLLNIQQHHGAYGILGASMAGLMSLYAGLRVPEIFGKVLTQSGGFGFNIFAREFVVFDLVRHGPVRPIKIWMDVGKYEFLHRVNERMYDALQERGYDVAYHAYHGGHNYVAWREDLVNGLQYMFGRQNS